MTLPEFFGCAFLAFGPALAMFSMTIAQDPIRIIILVAAAFLWLCSLLISSFIWFIFVPIRDVTIFGMIISILIQVNWWRRSFGFYCNFLYLRSAPMTMLLENLTVQRFLRDILTFNQIKICSFSAGSVSIWTLSYFAWNRKWIATSFGWLANRWKQAYSSLCVWTGFRYHERCICTC